MKVAYIAPPALLPLVPDTVHMMLPDQLLVSEVYRRFYYDVKGYKILDNGEAEGNQLSDKNLLMLARQFDVQEVVVPDSMGSMFATVARASDFAPIAASAPDITWAAVLQGQTENELLTCLDFFESMEWVDVICLPRYMNRQDPQSRVKFLQRYGDRLHESFLSIHCLGASYPPYEVHEIAQTGIVRSMDTSLPFSTALDNAGLWPDVYHPRQDNFFNVHVEEGSPIWQKAEQNVRLYEDWIKGTKEVS